MSECEIEDFYPQKCRLHWHKKTESFSHSGFLLKVARQLPLNTPKNPNRKTHLRSVIFWNSAEISLVFCQCKRSLQSRRYYSGFWSRGTWPSAESPDRGPQCNAHYTCTVKGRLPKHKYEIRGFFAHALFVPKTPNVMGFSGSVNGTTKNPGFLDFGFCQCKWAYWNLRNPKPPQGRPPHSINLAFHKKKEVQSITLEDQIGLPKWRANVTLIYSHGPSILNKKSSWST